jgi:hypothetical protein
MSTSVWLIMVRLGKCNGTILPAGLATVHLLPLPCHSS